MNTIDTSTEAVERLLEDVTPGPWAVDSGSYYCDVVTKHGFSDEDFVICEEMSIKDASFIAVARDLVPALLKERDEARALVAAAISRAEYHADRNTTAADVFRDVSALAKTKGADHE